MDHKPQEVRAALRAYAQSRVRAVLPDEAFYAHFSVPRLDALRPDIGSPGVPPGLLVCHLGDGSGVSPVLMLGHGDHAPLAGAGAPAGSGGLGPRQLALVYAVVPLDDPAFGETETRHGSLEAIGRCLARQHLRVAALFMRSEAWVRAFTQDEMRARGTREVASYADKQESIVIAGRAIDGRSGLACARIYRGHRGKIGGYSPWQVITTDTAEQPPKPILLEAAFRGYLEEAAAYNLSAN
jgi:hypothetical protein